MVKSTLLDHCLDWSLVLPCVFLSRASVGPGVRRRVAGGRVDLGVHGRSHGRRPRLRISLRQVSRWPLANTHVSAGRIVNQDMFLIFHGRRNR